MALIHYTTPNKSSAYTIAGTPINRNITVIPNRCIVTINGSPTNLRYIYGCSTILLEEQVKLGYKEDRKIEDRDVIRLINGNHFSDDADKTRIEYLDKCSYNRDAEGRDKSIQPLFYRVDYVKESTVNVQLEMAMYEAKKLILETLKKDRVKLRRVGEILLGNIDSQEDIQIIESLLTIANKFENNNKDKSGANKILATYKSISNDLSEKIDELIKEKIIVPSATKVITVEDNKELISFKVGSPFKKKLEDFFQTKDGEAQLLLLEELLSTKKKNSLASQTV
jgi:hypothetical protein